MGPRRNAVLCLVSALVIVTGILVTDHPTQAVARRSRRRTATTIPAGLALRAPTTSIATTPVATTPVATTPVATTAAPVSRTIAAAGDLVCAPGMKTTATECRHREVSAAIGRDPSVSAFLALGDLVYENGEAETFATEYRSSYGRLGVPTYPAAGNHEFNTPGGAGYFTYFGGQAGESGKGWYSVDLTAGWHLVVLNSNCGVVGCGADSEQVRWLRADLALSSTPCTIAIWHHPRFNSGKDHGDSPETAVLWQTLQDAGADLVLSGHEHLYERFAPKLPNGDTNAAGMASFVVGTGGRSMYPFGVVKPGSAMRIADTFGYLRLTLGDRRYEHVFVTENGDQVDHGSGTCH